MNIVIAGHLLFPTGSAAASRVRHLAKGFIELGHKAFVVTMSPQKGMPADPVHEVWYDYRNIPYYHAAGWAKSGKKNLCVRMKDYLLGIRTGLRNTIKQLDRLHKQDRIDAVLGYSNSYFGNEGLNQWCRANRIPVIRDVNEWMGPDNFPLGRLNPLYINSELNFHLSLPHSDGVIAISKFLEDHFSKLGVRVVRIPAIIDPELYATPETGDTTSTSKEFQLTYLGGMNWRDGPMLMLRAVREVLYQGHQIMFNIVGVGEGSRNSKECREYVDRDPCLRGRIKFWGRVSDGQVKDRLFSSDALMFNRVSGRQSQAAFPTRLPEFLMAGRPVITSDVGDIRDYLVDGREAIVVRPDDVQALTAGIVKVLMLPDRGRAIGWAGREKCIRCFHYRTRCGEIIEFIENRIL